MAWFNTAYQYKKQITLLHSQVSGGANLTNFPVLIAVTDSNLMSVANGGNVANSNGYDLIFTDATETTQLNHEISSYNAATGAITCWVRIPTLSASSDTTIYMYYGNAAIFPNNSQGGRIVAWDSNYKAVYHLDDGTSATLSDSTLNGLDLMKTDSTHPAGTAGQIATAESFDGSTAQAGSASSILGITGDKTVEAWVNAATFAADGGGFERRIVVKNIDGTNAFVLATWAGGPGFAWQVNDGGGAHIVSAMTYSTSTWYHVVGTYTASGSTVALYINGVSVSNGTQTAMGFAPVGNFVLGARTDGHGYFQGSLDEVRISNVVRSAGWIATSYNNQSNPGGFFTVGSQQAVPFTWLNAGYLYKKIVTIDHTKVSGGANLTNFPVLLSVTDAQLKTVANGGRVQSAFGYDMIFANATETTQLNHEIESYTASTGTLVFWVQLPSVSFFADTQFLLYYGNSSISTVQSTASSVWDTNYKAVYHLADAAAVSTLADSTANALSLTKTDTTHPNATSGKIAGGQTFDNSLTAAASTSSSLLNITGDKTVEAWINASTFAQTPGGNERRLIFKNIDGTNAYQINFNSATSGIVWQVNDGGGAHDVSSDSYSTGVWYHVVGTYTASGSVVALYINGVSKSDGAASGFGIATSGPFWLGQRGDGAFYYGSLDEVRVSNVVRSAGWITTSYTNQSSPSTFLSLSSGAPILSGGFALYANGTGTAFFDHFRVTQYPDPALSGFGVLPRAGSTLVAWQANTPTNTSVGMALSTDGVNWTDVTSQNGGSIPGIFSQPQPTVDGFSSNTSASYTSTSRTGGSTATWTWDTSHSRLTGTGGTHAILVNSSLSHADMEVIVDLDEADDGGIIVDFVDQSNYYALAIRDAQSNSGAANQIVLIKVASNVATALATVPISFYRGIPHRFRLTMRAGVLTAYMDGTQMLTYTDGSPLGAGKAGIRNNGGTSRYYSLWITPQGDVVTGTPAGDMVTGAFVYTKATLTSTDPTQTPQLLDLETFVGSPAIGTGTLIPKAQYQRTFIGKNLDDLAKQSNYSWYFTPSGSLVFTGRQAQPAPWILSSNTLALPSDIEMDSNLVVEVSGDLYRNRQILTNVLDTSAFSNSFNGDGSATSFALSYPVADGTIPTITLNNLSQTVGVKGASGYQWYYAAGDAVIAQDASGTKLLSTDVLTMSYTGVFSTEVVVDNTAAQTALADIEGGSGIVEAVEDVSSKNMFYDAAVTYANQLLDRYCITGRSVTFATYRNGLAVGMLLTAFIPEENLYDIDLLITQIDVTMQIQPNNTVLYKYIVQCTELANKKGWQALFANPFLS